MNKTLLLMAFAAISLIYAAKAISLENSSGSNKIIDVRQLGAKGDGKTIDTEAIQKALDECGAAGGGIVKLSDGVYLSKPIHLRSNTTLQIDENAKLKATDEPLDFLKPGRDLQNLKGSGDFIAFVNGKNLTNVSITGKGTIDGSGVRWWIPAEEARKDKPGYTSPRPRLILLEGCKNVKITGVTICNSPSFHLVPKGCENVLIEGITIRSPSIAPNTDAIDPSTSRYVLISDCVIDVGDDNIAIKSGHQDTVHPNAACEYINVIGCKFLHGHGMSIGSETNGGVQKLVVKNCTFENTESGIRIKSSREKGGLIQNLSYSDLTMKNVKAPINITTYYPKIPKDGNDKPQAITSLTPTYRNIRISNVTATSPKNAGFIVGLPECPVMDVVLENVHITAPKGLTIRNAKVTLKNVKIETQEGPPFILESGAVVEGLEHTIK